MAFIEGKINLGAIEKELDSMDSNFIKYQEAVLKDLQDIFIKNVEKKAPKKTGKYSKSWKAGPINGNKATIYTPFGMLYAMLEWTGRSPGRISGKLMVFEAETGETVFTMKIDHPGFDPVPHVRPALKKTMAECSPVLFAHLDKLSRMFDKVAKQNKTKAENLKK